MKYTSSLALCAGVAVATQNQMAKDLEMLKRNLSGNGAQLRAFTGIVATALDPISEYGCWCYFQQLKGSGPVQNTMDGLCKVLQQGYDCAILDGEVENEPCTPWEHPYLSGISIGGNGVEVECLTKNPGDNCAQRACVIEGNFVLNVFSQFFSTDPFDPSLKHSLGNFNPVGTCTSVPGVPNQTPGGSSGGTPSGRDCCGDYPVRAPYHLLNGAKDCCGVTVFNTDDLTCCLPAEVLQIAGSC